MSFTMFHTVIMLYFEQTDLSVFILVSNLGDTSKQLSLNFNP